MAGILFLPPPCARRATLLQQAGRARRTISTHALREEGDLHFLADLGKGQISTHALREEGDPGLRCCPRQGCISTHALREEGDPLQRRRHTVPRYFYPRPPRGGRRDDKSTEDRPIKISTHALREEGDARSSLTPLPTGNFYPRPPRGGRRRGGHGEHPLHDISPHALREACNPSIMRYTSISRISTHALREEGDAVQGDAAAYTGTFLPTPSARRATPCAAARGLTASNFYPRPPRGGRPALAHKITNRLQFLPTPSARRATCAVRHHYADRAAISTHALREEGDPPQCFAPADHPAFLPTPSARRATRLLRMKLTGFLFLPTPSARRATAIGVCLIVDVLISTHALREEGDPFP